MSPVERAGTDKAAGPRRARENAARELEQLRADAERERDEILARLADTAGRLSEVTTAHAAELERVRANAARERAERDLDAARAELARLRQ
jgi:hypothetical protein